MDSAPRQSVKQAVLFAFLSAFLSGIAFPPCGFSSLVWVSLIPWMYSLYYQTWKQILISHGVFETMFFLVGLFWMVSVHPICPIALLIPLYGICIVFPLLYYWAAQKARMPVWIVAPILWTANEYLRAFIFSGFPYLFLGHTQAYHPTLIQIADITGVYGVSFAIVMVNGMLLSWFLWWIEGKSKPKLVSPIAGSLVTAIMLAGILWYGNARLTDISYEYGPKIASIQGNIPQDIKDDPRVNIQRILEAYTKLTEEALKQNPDMLVWPETMSPGDLQLELRPWLLFRKMSKENRLPLLIGSHHYKCDFAAQKYQTYNSAYFIDPDGKIVERYDKIHLVPVGEYVPLRTVLPFLATIVEKIASFIPNLSWGEAYPTFSIGKYKFGCVICYDIAYSEDIRILANQGCDFVVNVTNEGWFTYTSEMEHLLASSIFRAVENRIGILRAANTGITIHIPPTGVVKKDHLLSIDISQYFQSLQPYIRDRVAGNFLFSISKDYGKELDKELMSLSLYETFQKKSFKLSQNLIVKSLAQGKEWLIQDNTNNCMFYLVVREVASFTSIHVFAPSSTFAWHHLPSALYNADEFLTTMEKDWDVKLDGQYRKWKDFPGFLVRQVPLKTKESSFYTRFGDAFAMLLGIISIAFAAMWVWSKLKWF